MKDSRFSDAGDTTPTHYGEPVPYGDFYAAATGADEELSQCEHRRDDKPALTLRFSTTAARQAFVDELLASLKADVSKSPWRHVALWGVGR